ncbi:hypothetical protein MHK_002602 [Candidatus Magnetomorum sp. HK-1]|nr:hypothetical protein MHK_002602 [Candidatus Magnetomorum sp. HK-1]
MKTDKELYKLFSSCPQLLFEAANFKPDDKYSMVSITFKEFERRTDGLLEPVSDDKPVYLVEFQAYWDNTVYHRLIMEMAAYGKENPKRDIRGILVFTNKNLDLKTLPWHELTKSDKNIFKVVYLETFLDDLEKKNPDHPLVSTFKPYREKDKKILKQKARHWYHNINSSSLPKPVKESFETVFTRWMQERFVNLSYKEVTQMFVKLTPLEETRSYKELVTLGEKSGEKKAAGKIVARIMAKKFDTKIQRISPRLRPLQTKDIMDLGDSLLAMNTFEDALRWINERKKVIQGT